MPIYYHPTTFRDPMAEVWSKGTIRDTSPMRTDHAMRTAMLTAMAMTAFSANSVLCRLALSQPGADPAAFTLIRIASGALTLWLLTVFAGRGGRIRGSWPGALALLGYAAAFSYAYVSLTAGTGALLLFAAVQATMIIRGLVKGERLIFRQWVGLILALTGLTVMVAPGVTAPPPVGATLMVFAGIAWGAYSLLGRDGSPPLEATAGNFVRAAPLALLLALPVLWHMSAPPTGIVYAVLSGALASGIGYALWYAALPGLRAASAASVQLSVPVITALAGALLLGEVISLRLIAASASVLGGIALVVLGKARK